MFLGMCAAINFFLNQSALDILQASYLKECNSDEITFKSKLGNSSLRGDFVALIECLYFNKEKYILSVSWSLYLSPFLWKIQTLLPCCIKPITSQWQHVVPSKLSTHSQRMKMFMHFFPISLVIDMHPFRARDGWINSFGNNVSQIMGYIYRPSV